MILTLKGLSTNVVAAQFVFDDDHVVILDGASLEDWKRTQQVLFNVYVAAVNENRQKEAAAAQATTPEQEDVPAPNGLEDLLDK